jgi:hypothetical protein
VTATLHIPRLHLGRGENDREHPFVKASRVKQERGMVWSAFHFARFRGWACPAVPPFHVVITRIAPSDGLDSDNLVGACKHVRDQTAICLGLVKLDRRGREVAMDGPKDPITFECRQERGEWGVRLEISQFKEGVDAEGIAAVQADR